MPFAFAWSAAGVFALYAIPILAILIVLPTAQITSLGGFIDAMKTVFTVYGGHVSPDGSVHLSGLGRVLGDLAAAGFIFVLFSGGAVLIIAAHCTPTAAGLHRAGGRERWPL